MTVGSEQSDITPNVRETPAAGDPGYHYGNCMPPPQSVNLQVTWWRVGILKLHKEQAEHF